MEHNYVANDEVIKEDNSLDAADHSYVGTDASKPDIFQCHVCDSVLKHRASLYKHLKYVHKVSPGGKKWMRCLEKDCNADFVTSNYFREHLSRVHKIKMKTEELLFNNMSEFKIWKVEMESKNNVQYVKDTGAHLSRDKMNYLYYFRCNRTGKYRDHRKQSERKRKLKSQGSDKINNHCTSMMIVQEPIDKKSSIKVTYHITHYGHEIDPAHIRLSELERKKIAERLKQGDSVNTILDKIKVSVTPDHKKIHLITKKNIQRIGKSFGIVSVKAEKRSSKRKNSGKTADVQGNHIRSLSTSLSAVKELSDESWIVSARDDSDDDHIVVKNEFLEENHVCYLRCEECDICIHMFSCECPDNIVKSELCEHIHLVAGYLNQRETPSEMGEESFDVTGDEESQTLVQPNRPTVVEKREKLLSSLPSINLSIMECDEAEILDVVQEHVNAIENLFKTKKQFSEQGDVENKNDKENLEQTNTCESDEKKFQLSPSKEPPHKKLALKIPNQIGAFFSLYYPS